MLHTNSGVHIGLANVLHPMLDPMVDGATSASLLDTAALLGDSQPLDASLARLQLSGEQGARDDASMQLEQPAMVVAAGMAMDGGMVVGSRVEQVRVATFPVNPLRTAALSFTDEEAAPRTTAALPARPSHPGVQLEQTAMVAALGGACSYGPQDGGSWCWCRATGEWIADDGPSARSRAGMAMDGGMDVGSRVEQVRVATFPVNPLRTAALSFTDEEAAPQATSSRPARPSRFDVDGGLGGLNDLYCQSDPFYYPGFVDEASSVSSETMSSTADACSLGDGDEAAPLSRGIVWLRSAWRDIVRHHIIVGPRRRGETDFDLLTRVGFWHDDRFCEGSFGWADAVEMGYPPHYLGGQIFQPTAPFMLDAAWARAAWQRALRGTQAQLMGARGQAWLALRAAERVQRAAFRAVSRERRILAGCWLAPVRRERAGTAACAEAAYLRAARRSEAYRIPLRVRSDGDGGARRRGRRGRRGPDRARAGRG